MNHILRTTTFRTFYQGVVVTLSLRQRESDFIVRCQPYGYPLIPAYDTVCATLDEAERAYTHKFCLGMG